MSAYEREAVDAAISSRCMSCERGQHDRCELLQRPDAEGYMLAAECRCLHESREQHALKRAERARALMLAGDWAAAGREWVALAAIAKKAALPLTGKAATDTLPRQLRPVPAPHDGPCTKVCGDTLAAWQTRTHGSGR